MVQAAAAARSPPPPPLTALPLSPVDHPRSKIFASLLAGVFAGVVGITGFKGFIVYAAAHAIMSCLLLLKAGAAPQRYFASA